MQKRRLGQTNIDVSVIGLGTVKFGRNQGVKYPQSFTLPTLDELERLLTSAGQLGINLIDTAPAYGESEIRLGQLLKNKRENWIISTKVGEQFIDGQSYFNFTREHINQSIDESLKRLATDYLDIVLVHSHGDDLKLITEENVFTTLALLKQQGKIRAFGMSTKTLAGGLATIDLADLAMITYNPLYRDEHEVIAYAHQKQKGILIKKVFASGHLPQELNCANPYTYALKFALKEEGVSSVIVGTINREHLAASAKALV